MEGFRKFVLRGNVVDLAVGVVIGAAFTAIVTATVNGIINPFIGLFGLGSNLQNKAVCIGTCVTDSKTGLIGGHYFTYGQVISAAINFIIVAAVIYFFVVQPVNRLMSRFKTEPEPDAPTRDCPQCLSSIPAAASRCAFCTSEVPALA